MRRLGRSAQRRYQIIPEWRRGILGNFIAFSVFVIALAVTSSLGDLLIFENAHNYPIVGDALNGQPWWISFTLGALSGAGLCTLLISLRLVSDDLYEALTEGLLSRRSPFKMVMYILLVAAIIFIVPAWVMGFLGAHSEGATSFIGEHAAWVVASYLAGHTGGAVGFIISIVTLVAFALTIQQLRDFQNRITSFKDLLKRVEYISGLSSADDKLHVIAYTPAVGFLAQPKRDWNRMRNSMLAVDEDEKHKTRVVVLNETLLKQWHDKFIGRRTLAGTVSVADADGSQIEAMKIKSALGCDYIELDYESLPGYYCFFTSSRAIIATPMFLPIYGQNADERTKLPSTHMLGYETSDRATIDDLFHQFSYLEETAPVPPGGVT